MERYINIHIDLVIFRLKKIENAGFTPRKPCEPAILILNDNSKKALQNQLQ